MPNVLQLVYTAVGPERAFNSITNHKPTEEKKKTMRDEGKKNEEGKQKKGKRTKQKLNQTKQKRE